MNHGKEELADRVGGDLSEGEMEGLGCPQWNCCYCVFLMGGDGDLLGSVGLVELFLTGFS